MTGNRWSVDYRPDLQARHGQEALNGAGHLARLIRKVLRLLIICHLRTRPYTPKTHGKAERFMQNLLCKPAYAIPFRSSEQRAADLLRWLAW